MYVPCAGLELFAPVTCCFTSSFRVHITITLKQLERYSLTLQHKHPEAGLAGPVKT